MTPARRQFRRVLARSRCTVAANIYDPVSARIAQMVGYEVCVLSSTVAKSASLAVPDLVLANMTDLVEHCRRILRAADVSLMVDADDGFGSAVNVVRTVQELEAVGVAAIELDDNLPRTRLDQERAGLVSVEEHVGKLRAALAARADPSTVIVARTSALVFEPLKAALKRIRAYTDSGSDALMLYGLRRERADIEAVHNATRLPLLVHPKEADTDPAFLAANSVRIRMLGQVAYPVAVMAIYDALRHLQEGGSVDTLGNRRASAELLHELNRSEHFLDLQREFVRPSS